MGYIDTFIWAGCLGRSCQTDTLAYSIPADASSERAFPGLYSQRSKIYLRTEVSALCFFSFTLLFLGTQYTRTKWKHSAPELCGLNRRNYWRILSLREVFQPSFNPHAIMELLSDVPANHAENCLTLQEVSAVLTVMVARTSDRPFRDHPIHPVSILLTLPSY